MRLGTTNDMVFCFFFCVSSIPFITTSCSKQKRKCLDHRPGDAPTPSTVDAPRGNARESTRAACARGTRRTGPTVVPQWPGSNVVCAISKAYRQLLKLKRTSPIFRTDRNGGAGLPPRPGGADLHGDAERHRVAELPERESTPEATGHDGGGEPTQSGSRPGALAHGSGNGGYRGVAPRAAGGTTPPATESARMNVPNQREW